MQQEWEEYFAYNRKVRYLLINPFTADLTEALHFAIQV